MGGTDVRKVPPAEDVTQGGKGRELAAAAVHARDGRGARGA